MKKTATVPETPLNHCASCIYFVYKPLIVSELPHDFKTARIYCLNNRHLTITPQDTCPEYLGTAGINTYHEGEDK